MFNTRITIIAAHETWHQQPVLTETMDLAASSAITMQMDSCKARKEWSWQAVGTQVVPSYIAQTSRRHHHHPPPQVLEERRNIFHDLDIQGAARTRPNSGTPHRVRRRLHTSLSVYDVPGSDEFKKKENKISESPNKEDAAHSCTQHNYLSMAIGAEDNVKHTPLRPPSPPPAHMYDTAPQWPRVGTPTLPTKQVACLQADCRVVDCRHHFICPPIKTPARQHECQST
jgi:hypothetical protein